MCGGVSFHAISSVKVLGPKLGRGSAAPKMRDGDGDGKCQEEDGKWIPCPPGVSDGSVINAAGQALRRIGTPIGESVQRTKPVSKPADQIAKARKKAAAKAEKIQKAAAKAVSDDQKDAAASIQDLLEDLVKRPRDERDEIRQDLTAAIETMFVHTVTGNDGKKYKTEIEEIRIHRGDGFTVDGQIFDSSGTMVGFFTRTYYQNDRKMEHYEMRFFHKKHQGLGLGSAINARNEQLYKEMGVKEIYLSGLSTPAGYKGATHWPKNGFNWKNLSAKREFTSTIRAAIERYRKVQNGETTDNTTADGLLFESMEQAQQLLDLLARANSEPMAGPATGPDLLEAGDLLHWPGAEEWFQRARANIEYKRDL